jgi:hypothetical protein
MTHIAIHDALNAIDRRSRPYAYEGSAQPTASPDAAVAAAARDVLVTVIGQIPAPFPPACLAAGVASAEASYAAALALIPDGPAKTEGIQVGQAAAASILVLRANDGSDTPLLVFDFPQGANPGEHRFVPGFNFEFAPGWADVTPFVLNHAALLPRRATGVCPPAPLTHVATIAMPCSARPTTREAVIRSLNQNHSRQATFSGENMIRGHATSVP